MLNPTTKRTISDAHIAQSLDPNKTTLICGIHKYTAGDTLHRGVGCKDCNMVDFMTMFAKMDPARRAEKLDEFEGLIHALCELEDKGELDINVFQRPIITFEKE